MRLRTLSLILTLALLVAPLAVEAQLAGKVYRIGYLLPFSPTSSGPGTPNLEAFRKRLRELGWVEGQNIVTEYRWSEGRAERFPHLAAELASLKVDVIYAPYTPAALAAKQATTMIPIVFVGGADPVGAGLVASLARPGGNVTGLSLVAGPEMVGKQVDLLKQALPKVSRMALLWNPANPGGSALAIREGEAAARSLGVELQILEASTLEELESAFSVMKRERAGALVVFADPVFIRHRPRLVDLSAKNHLPAIFALRDDVEAGGLMSYGPNALDLWRRAATYVDKILKGAKPADLPVEQPTKFELVINLKTAKALGLTIPQSVLIRADEVIQ